MVLGLSLTQIITFLQPFSHTRMHNTCTKTGRMHDTLGSVLAAKDKKPVQYSLLFTKIWAISLIMHALHIHLTNSYIVSCGTRAL
jgi:hypothetical protein